MSGGAVSMRCAPRPSGGRVWVNVAAFQAGWFACVLGGAWSTPWFGIGATAILVAGHLGSVARPGVEARLLAVSALLGTIWDSSLVMLGWLEYASGTLVAGAAPGWIVAMWVLFATTLNISLNWLKGRPALAAAFGAMGGPLAYYAGAKLGAVSFPDPALALGAQAIGWAILMPLLMHLAVRFDGTARAPAR